MLCASPMAHWRAIELFGTEQEEASGSTWNEAASDGNILKRNFFGVESKRNLSAISCWNRSIYSIPRAPNNFCRPSFDGKSKVANLSGVGKN